jgi:hypothetical protein
MDMTKGFIPDFQEDGGQLEWGALIVTFCLEARNKTVER